MEGEGSKERARRVPQAGVRRVEIPPFIRNSIALGVATALAACSAETGETYNERPATHIVDGAEGAEQQTQIPKLSSSLSLDPNDNRTYGFSMFNMPQGQIIVVDPYDPANTEGAVGMDIEKVKKSPFVTNGDKVTQVNGALEEEAAIGAGYKVRVYKMDTDGNPTEIEIVTPAEPGQIEGNATCIRAE